MNDITAKIIGEKINTLLVDKGIKQKELAKHLNVSDNTISYFVAGKRMPNTEQIIKIAQFFEVSSDYLLGLTDVQSTEIKIKEICDYIGLNECSVETLHYILLSKKEFGLTFDTVLNYIDFILSNDIELIEVGAYLNSAKKTLIETISKLKENTPSAKAKDLNHNIGNFIDEQQKNYKITRFEIIDIFQNIFDDYFETETEQIKTLLTPYNEKRKKMLTQNKKHQE